MHNSPLSPLLDLTPASGSLQAHRPALPLPEKSRQMNADARQRNHTPSTIMPPLTQLLSRLGYQRSFTPTGKLHVLLLTGLLLCCCGLSGLHAATFGDFEYTDNGTSITITGYTSTGGVAGFEITIPPEINGIPVTTIGEGAFSYIPMGSVSIPSSVTSIGSQAFYFCRDLRQFAVDSGNNDYASIDGVLFNKSITHLIQYPAGMSGSTYTIPDGVISIEGLAFYYTHLDRLNIPKSITTIGDGAFSFCYLLFEVDSENANYASIDGVLFNKSITHLIQYPAKKSDSIYTIPDSVTSIEEWAFSGVLFSGNRNLTCVNIPNSVITIGDAAFKGCAGLTSLNLPDSVTSIGNEAFKDCTGLTTVTIPSSVSTIGKLAFSYHSLAQFVVDIDNASFASIDGVLFNKSITDLIQYPAGKSGTTFTIPDSVMTIGELAFSDCTGLESVSIPSTVTTIGNSAFTGCAGLTSVSIPNSVISIGDKAFYDCAGLSSVSIPINVTSMGDSVFEHCTGLTNVNIPDGVTHIGKSAFRSCTGITYVNIPNSVISIGDEAFYHCTALSSVSIADGVISIGEWSFSGCNGLASVRIPSSVSSIGSSAFSYCELRYAYFEGDAPLNFFPNTFYDNIIDYNPREIDRYFFTVYYLNNALGFTSPTWYDYSTSKVEAFGDFIYHDEGTSITLLGCPGAIGVLVIPSTIKGKPVTIIGEHAFAKYSDITSVSIPNSVSTIGSGAFSYCTGLTRVNIPTSVTSLDSAAFLSCTGLASVYFEGDAPANFSRSIFLGTASNFTLYYHQGTSGFSSPTLYGYPTANYSLPFFFTSPKTADLGTHFAWNNLFGYLYTGFHPFAYDFTTEQWLYIFGDYETEGYYLYGFKLGHWYYTHPDYYEDRWILDMTADYTWLEGL